VMGQGTVFRIGAKCLFGRPWRRIGWGAAALRPYIYQVSGFIRCTV